MNKKQIRKPLKDLNLADRFLFDEVMEDAQANQDVLSIIFGKDITLMGRTETEKELRVSPLLRSIRMDVVSMDEEQTVYNAEMQSKRKNDLVKRSRYYQALVDTNLLEPGIPNYNVLNATYIIMIMTFDLFGYEKYCYTFEAICREVPECTLGDKAVRIFLNTKGKNREEVSQELVDFLSYVEHSADEVAEASGSERIKRLHKRVCKVKASEEVGVKYMQAWEEKYYEREEAREEGIKEGIETGEKRILKMQIEKKLAKGKSVEEIAFELEVDTEMVEKIMREADIMIGGN